MKGYKIEMMRPGSWEREAGGTVGLWRNGSELIGLDLIDKFKYSFFFKGWKLEAGSWEREAGGIVGLWRHCSLLMID